MGKARLVPVQLLLRMQLGYNTNQFSLFVYLWNFPPSFAFFGIIMDCAIINSLGWDCHIKKFSLRSFLRCCKAAKVSRAGVWKLEFLSLGLSQPCCLWSAGRKSLFRTSLLVFPSTPSLQHPNLSIRHCTHLKVSEEQLRVGAKTWVL